MAVRYAALVLACLIGTGCSSVAPHATGSFVPNGSERASEVFSPGTYIKHVVIIIQENRSFDNIFPGYPGANTSLSGLNGKARVNLHPITFFTGYAAAGALFLAHDFSTAVNDFDSGKMDGFANTSFNGSQNGKAGTFPYAYVERSETAPYWTMAKEYTLADAMFPTMFGGSFTGHLSLIASTASLSPTLSEVNWPTVNPWSCAAPRGTDTATLNTSRFISTDGPFPCFTQFRTMADTLDAAHVSWKYYAPSLQSGDPGGQVWSEFGAIKNVYLKPDWAKVVSPQTTVLSDIATGKLASMTWVAPDWADSDYLGSNSDAGPSWVASIVNAIGKSQYWQNTAIVVLWDDWGGWYDNAAPLQKDYRGLGMRVPCIIISPYVKPNTVMHTQYEFGSVLKFAEQVFNLAPLGTTAAGYTDTRAASILDSFDFTQKPLVFKTIPAKYPASHFSQERPSLKAPDPD